MGELFVFPNKPKVLTREELRSGMRVMLPDGQCPGTIISVTDEKLIYQMDGANSPSSYDWEFAPNFVRGK